MHERLINFGAWRNKEQMLRFRGVRCSVCGHVSLEDKPCYHTHEDSHMKAATEPVEPEKGETNDRPEAA